MAQEWQHRRATPHVSAAGTPEYLRVSPAHGSPASWTCLAIGSCASFIQLCWTTRSFPRTDPKQNPTRWQQRSSVCCCSFFWTKKTNCAERYSTWFARKFARSRNNSFAIADSPIFFDLTSVGQGNVKTLLFSRCFD